MRLKCVIAIDGSEVAEGYDDQYFSAALIDAEANLSPAEQRRYISRGQPGVLIRYFESVWVQRDIHIS